MQRKVFISVAMSLLLLPSIASLQAQIVTYQTLYEEVSGTGWSRAGFHQGPTVAIYPDAAASYYEDMIGGAKYGHIVYRNSPTSAYRIDLPANLLIEDMEAYPLSNVVVFCGQLSEHDTLKGVIGSVAFYASNASVTYMVVHLQNDSSVAIPVTKVTKLAVFTGVSANDNGVVAICNYRDTINGSAMTRQFIYRGPAFFLNSPIIQYDLYELISSAYVHNIVATDDYVCIVGNYGSNSMELLRARIMSTSLLFDPCLYRFSNHGYDIHTQIAATSLNYQKPYSIGENDIALSYSSAGVNKAEPVVVIDLNTMTEVNVQVVHMGTKAMVLGIKYLPDCSTLVMLNGEDPLLAFNAKTVMYLDPYNTTTYTAGYIGIEPSGYCYIDRLPKTASSLSHFVVGWSGGETVHWFFKDACASLMSDCNEKGEFEVEILPVKQAERLPCTQDMKSFFTNYVPHPTTPTFLYKDTICIQE